MSGFSDSFQEQIAALEAAFANEGTLAVAVLQISPFSTRGNRDLWGFRWKVSILEIPPNPPFCGKGGNSNCGPISARMF